MVRLHTDTYKQKYMIVAVDFVTLSLNNRCKVHDQP